MTRVRAATAVLLTLLAGCSAGPATPGAPAPSPAPGTTTGAAGSGSPSAPGPSTGSAEPVEPTTTNTLPPPPAPSAPAPSTAGELDAAELPVPPGWRTVALEGGDEEGFRGNGTWVHARDPRYAAQDVITIGCADVTRDDYPDPVAALEGNYSGRSGAPGVGLVLQFADADAAGRYWSRYRAQVRACEELDEPVRTDVLLDADGLVDRRRYPDGDWTEVSRQAGARITLVILNDEGRRLSLAHARRLLAGMG